MLNADQQQAVLELARAVLRSHVAGDGALAEWHAQHAAEGALAAPAGAFVTLHRTGGDADERGRLRACMGVLEAREPLVDAVTHAAEAAAHDPRFPALREDELDRVELEVSVLSPPSPVAGAAAIEVGRHGVILSKSGRSAVFLPQVATEQGWDVEAMLAALVAKAGLPRDAWRDGARLEVFTAQVFGEGAAG